jgi:hypothetical protein
VLLIDEKLSEIPLLHLKVLRLKKCYELIKVAKLLVTEVEW